ncbi:MAG: glycosyltransferase family 2 protein [Acidimicrobiales bacterium]
MTSILARPDGRQVAVSADTEAHEANAFGGPDVPVVGGGDVVCEGSASVEVAVAAEAMRVARSGAAIVLADAAGEADAALDQACREADAVRASGPAAVAEVEERGLDHALAILAAAEARAQALVKAATMLVDQATLAPPKAELARTPAAGPGVRAAPPRPGAPTPEKAPVAAPSSPTLVPVLSYGRELVLRLLVLSGVVTSAWFWLWWLGNGHGRWGVGSVAATGLLGWLFLLSAYFWFFISRMTRPDPSVPLVDGRVAMIVTKAPSEDWDIVLRTLEAMLAQAFPRPFDTWLADERPSLATLEWCLAHGVKVSTRYGVSDYHRRSWPRRTKSKEGNLAYFYDCVGYRDYDVVVQLDADHVPAAGYLEAMVRPFADPKIGYVCAPSICDANVSDGWTVRGRLYREASMHGPVQAGCNGGYAPVCIGSHYAVRTAALHQVGGLGPELAEDYSTTLWMQAGGWDGVFSIDAVAHGDGPATVEEMLVQELQWSRSLSAILFRWAPRRLRTVPWRARARLAFALLYYPVQALVVVCGTLATLVGVVVRSPWGDTSLAGFYLHLWPASVATMAIAAYLRRCRLLRPVQAKIWSWELILFQIVRWPWTLLGVVQGAYAGLRSSVVNFKVTPKSVTGARPLSIRYVLPGLALGAVPAAVVVLVKDPGPAVGLMVLAVTQGLTQLVCVVVVVALHIRGNRRRKVPGSTDSVGISAWRAGWAAAGLTAGVVLATIGTLAWRLW